MEKVYKIGFIGTTLSGTTIVGFVGTTLSGTAIVDEYELNDYREGKVEIFDQRVYLDWVEELATSQTTNK